MFTLGNKLRRPSPIQGARPAAICLLTAEIRGNWNPYDYEVRRDEAQRRQQELFGGWASGKMPCDSPVVL